MPGRIEDYAMVGDLHTAALIGSDGSVDWLCFPRFDSPACFAALLGEDTNGRWRMAPTSGGRCTTRRYRGHALILETEWETPDGAVRVVDCMPPRGKAPHLIRVVEGIRGKVPITSELRIRFDYGHVAPWVTVEGREVRAIAGPDALWLRASAPNEEVGEEILSRFTVSEGERVPFVLTWAPSYGERPLAIDGLQAVDDTERFWLDWAGGIGYEGRFQDAVYRSLLTLKGLTYEPSGGIVAAATTSLPETLGGSRNWDYRYCWLRDSTFTLGALVGAGLHEEARAWQQWVLRAVAGDPADAQIMYGIDGARRLPELELSWLSGYQGSRPVRVGNAAADQLQLDVWGETLDGLSFAREARLSRNDDAWALQKRLLDFLEGNWRQPDNGLWEMRGPRRDFVHSKVMSWVAFDRMIAGVEHFGLDGPVESWRRTRQEIFDEVVTKGYDADRNTFTQAYG